MVLSKDQKDEIRSGVMANGNLFGASKRRQWPLPIAYEFDPSIGIVFCYSRIEVNSYTYIIYIY